MQQPQSIPILGQILEARASTLAPGHEIRATVVQGGKSVNGYFYDAEALASIAQLVEGARAYADHGRTEADQATRSVRDMVGFYKDAEYIPPQPSGDLGRVEATLHIFESAAWLSSMIDEAVKLGRPELVGVSIDIMGIAEADKQLHAHVVKKVLSLNSCDVVTRPSAGGAFQRILHHSTSPEGTAMPEDFTQASQPTQATPPTPPTPTTPPAAQPSTAHITGEIARMQEEQRQALAQLRIEQEAAAQMRAEQQRIIEQARRDRCSVLLERKLIESGFPQAVQSQVTEQFTGRIFEEAELDASIERMRTMLAGLADSGLIRGMGYERAQVGQMITEAEKLQAAFDLMFADDKVAMLNDSEKSKFAGIRPFLSIREAYVQVSGDAGMSGSQNRDLGRIRVSEHAPITRITEADTTTASFSYLLGTSMNKRLLKDYQAWPAEWQKFVTIVPIKDFKQQTRVRLGAFGSLSTVPEDTAYTTISLQDSAATYVPTKRGNLVSVSRETIINDDLFAIKQIPTKLAVAAAYTLAEFVYAFLSSNANIFDGSALFTTGAPHTNLGTSALSSAAMQTGITAMREQTNFAGKRLGLRPSYVIVPAELEFTSMVITKSAGVPGSANNDINPMLGYVTPIVSPQLTNTTQWFLACDPRVVDTIEIGFVGGQVNPALFIQDQPLFGLNFTQDVISYKLRHEYGGAVIDFRGLYRGV